MSTLRALLEPIIAEAVNNAVAAYRQMLLAEGGGGATPANKRIGRPPGSKNKVNAAAPADTTKDPRQVANENAAAAVLTFITASPGLRSEQIAKGMGTRTAIVKKALAKLRDKEQVKTKGQKRGMTYHPAGSSAESAKLDHKNGTAPPHKTTKRKKGTHRKKKDIAANDARVLAFIKASPGLRTEQIVKGLGGDVGGDISFALAHLRAATKIKAKGYGRGTVYSF